MTYYAILKTKIAGDLLLIANETDLIGLHCTDGKRPRGIKRHWVNNPRQAVLAETIKQMKEYLKGTRKAFNLPLHFEGTEFQEKIWHHAMKIPYGQTAYYSELAQKAGRPAAVRAAGSAMAKNPINIIVPAHRVVAKSGGASGFAGRWNRKANLTLLEKFLRLEQSALK